MEPHPNDPKNKNAWYFNNKYLKKGLMDENKYMYAMSDCEMIITPRPHIPQQ